MASDILSKFKKTVIRYQMIAPGDNVLVAYSGGPDSTALLHLLCDLRREFSLELTLAHFNHKLRASADRDERFVRDAARRLNLPLVVRRRDVKAFARAKKLNLEEAARILRYDFLEKTAAQTGADKIATGHTLNDQAETFLIRLLRGAGPRGLGGIFPVVEGKIVRPLIEIPRKDVVAYCRARKLSFCADETNKDRRFLRNKIRLGLVPYLEKNYEPRVAAKLGRLALILQDEESFLDKITGEECTRLVVRKNHRLSLNARRLAMIPRALARRCVRAFIEEIKGDLRRISFEDVEAVLGLRERQELSFPGDLILRRDSGYIYLKGKPAPKIPYSYFWDGNHPLPIIETGMMFSGEKINRAKGALPFDDTMGCFCDAEKLRFPLLVRSRKEGDRYRPLGAPGRKKLKEILRAKRIPLYERDMLPVFCSEGKIIWAPGLPVAEDFKVTAKTRTVYCLKKIGLP